MKKAEKLQRELEHLLFKTMKVIGKSDIDFGKLTIGQQEFLDEITRRLPETPNSINFDCIAGVGITLAEMGNNWYSSACHYFNLAHQAPDFEHQDFRP